MTKDQWITLGVVAGAVVLAGGITLWWEMRTLADNVPGNHITQSFRDFVASRPHLAILLFSFFSFNLGLILGGIGGHMFHAWGGK